MTTEQRGGHASHSSLFEKFQLAYDKALREAQGPQGRGVWSRVLCECGKEHSWDDYLLCKDAKLPEILRWSIRPRKLEAGVYHVTELINPRYSFYERTTEFADRVVDKLHFFVGKAIHVALQEAFPQQWREVEVFKDFNVDGEVVTLVGHIDAIDMTTGIMYELKSISSTLWKQKFGVDKRHVWQLSAYWNMFRENRPAQAARLRDACIAYISKSREYKASPWMEFHSSKGEVSLAMPPVEDRLVMLHRALKTGIAPPHLCDDITTLLVKPYVKTEKYPCKGCKFRETCVKAYEAAGGKA